MLKKLNEFQDHLTTQSSSPVEALNHNLHGEDSVLKSAPLGRRGGKVKIGSSVFIESGILYLETLDHLSRNLKISKLATKFS